ncbi:MAG TPA: TolC family protein [Anaeromyxobacteraceae bacterium]|nr:TolC family protein [Anaeromyxobacteraceae bacterium]
MFLRNPRRLLAAPAVLCVLCLGLSAPAPALAQARASAPSDPVLERLVREALESRPELSQARSLVRAAEERVPQVGRLPDPILTLGIQNDGFKEIQIGTMETSWWQVMLTQPLPWPGKLGFRADAAALEAKGAEASLERVRLSVEADVRRAYLDLLLARDRLQLLSRLEALWTQSAGLAKTRYEVGDGPQSDLLRAQLELTRLRQRRWSLEAEERTRVQELNRLRSHALEEPIATTLSLRELPDPPLPGLEEARADAESRSPELAAARFGRQASERQLDLARRERYPDFAVTAGVMPRGQLEPMWLVSVGITLPVYGRQSHGVEEGLARERATADGEEAVRQLLRLRVQERQVLLAALLPVVQLYRSGLLVQSEATVASTTAQYRVGRVTFASVLEALAGYLADVDGFLQAISETQRVAIAQREVSLQAAGGGGGALGGGGIPGAGAVAVPAGGAAPGAAQTAEQGAAPMSRM